MLQRVASMQTIAHATFGTAIVYTSLKTPYCHYCMHHSHHSAIMQRLACTPPNKLAFILLY